MPESLSIAESLSEVADAESSRPLCIDLDQTLIATDLLQESILIFLKGNLLRIFQMVWWLSQGRPRLKSELAKRVEIPPSAVPWRQEVIAAATSAKKAGRAIYLVTAANAAQATQLVAHLGLFDAIFGSDETCNLKGRHKAAFLVRKFGAKKFDYIGDSRADLAVWAESAGGMVVASPRRVEEARKVNPNLAALPLDTSGFFLDLLKLMRVHQWSKNLIIFVPVITSHNILGMNVIWPSLAAFGSFCCIASATYICNDFVDLEHDRVHRLKHRRPLASGAITIPLGLAVACVLTLGSVALAWCLPPSFWMVLGLYTVITLSYSLYLKRTVLADVIVLACLYTIRLIAGHAATNIALSVWLLAFAVFIFFSLALAKRFSEVKKIAPSSGDEKIRGRGYFREDLPSLLALGTSSGITAVLVLVLYVNSPEVRQLYAKPMLLLLIAPAFLFWIGRIWILAQRGDLHEDPVLYAIKDIKSYLAGAFALAVMIVASLWK